MEVISISSWQKKIYLKHSRVAVHKLFTLKMPAWRQNAEFVFLFFGHYVKRVSVFGVILVHIFPAFSSTGTEYGEIWWTRITPNTVSFYAVSKVWELSENQNLLAVFRIQLLGLDCMCIPIEKAATFSIFIVLNRPIIKTLENVWQTSFLLSIPAILTDISTLASLVLLGFLC